MKLSKQERETFWDCRGCCRVCLLDGGCSLQNKLAKIKREANKRPVIVYGKS